MFNISIIIPTYNRKLFLMHAIDSVLNQTYQNLELNGQFPATNIGSALNQ